MKRYLKYVILKYQLVTKNIKKLKISKKNKIKPRKEEIEDEALLIPLP